jgi:hypothetical protein
VCGRRIECRVSQQGLEPWISRTGRSGFRRVAAYALWMRIAPGRRNSRDTVCALHSNKVLSIVMPNCVLAECSAMPLHLRLERDQEPVLPHDPDSADAKAMEIPPTMNTLSATYRRTSARPVMGLSFITEAAPQWPNRTLTESVSLPRPIDPGDCT